MHEDCAIVQTCQVLYYRPTVAHVAQLKLSDSTVFMLVG